MLRLLPPTPRRLFSSALLLCLALTPSLACSQSGPAVAQTSPSAESPALPPDLPADLPVALSSTPAVSLGQAADLVPTTSGCVPDGGLCLVPPEHYSDPVTVSVPVGGRQVGLHPNVIYGTGRAELVASDGRVLLAVSDSLLHGHEAFNPKRPVPYFDYRDGVFRDRGRRFQAACQEAGYARTGCVLNITYRYATSDARLERAGLAQRGARVDTLDVAWWGVEPDAERDYQPLLAHILNVARFRRSEVVQFSECGDYGYYGSLALPDIEILGTGGTEVVDAQTTVDTPEGPVTLDYRPVRVVDCPTRLLALPQTAHLGLYRRLPENDRRRQRAEAAMTDEAKAKIALRSWATAVYPQSGVMNVTLRHLVIDSNLDAQMPEHEALGRDEAGRALFEEYHRNSPNWSGFTSQGHRGVRVPQGQRMLLEGVAILGFPSDMVGIEANFWTIRQGLFGGNTRNHAAYCSNGEWEDVTLTNFSWTFVEMCPKPGFAPRSTVKNLVVERAASNPTYWPDFTVVNSRGASWDLDGFFFDLRGTDLVDPFEGVVDQFTARNGVILSGPNLNDLWHGYDNGRYRGKHAQRVEMENVTVYLGGSMGSLVGVGRNRDVRFHDVEIIAAQPDGEEAVRLGRLAKVRAARPGRRPELRVFDRVRVGAPMSQLATVFLPESVPEAATEQRIASMRASGLGAATVVAVRDSRLTNQRVEKVRGSDAALLRQLVRVCGDSGLTRAMSNRERDWLGTDALCDSVWQRVAAP
ncbi:MAG: hypothetical protein AAGI91_14925 [Bacteroidota bacterium]